MNRLRHGAIHQQQQCDVSPEIPDIRIVPDEHSSAPSDSCPPSLRASQADISGSSNNSNAEEQKILLNPSGLSPMYSSLQINDVDSDRENSELLTPPGTPFRDRAGSGSKWAKVRTSVKVAGAVQSTMRKRTRKGSPLVRQDSFLKRFSMRHAGETNNEEAVYDNDEERAWHQRFVVNPDENFMFFWLGVITVAVLYNLWTSIAREGFREIQRGYEPIWLSMDALCDLLYLCDIAVQLRTGYLEKGLIVCNTKKLACHYIFAKYFVLDLLSLLPLDLLQFYIGIHPIIRFPRFIKIYRSHRFAYMVETRTIYPNMWRVVNLSHVLFLGSHWFAAFYFMISKAEGFRGNWGYPTPEGEFASVARQYLKSLYWSTLTLTTIGDLPPPESNWDWLRKMPPHRYVFTIVSYLIGVFVFATIVGQVGNVITNRNASRQEFERLLDSAKAYMRNHNVPANMQRRVQRWYDYAWSRGRMNGGGDINSLGLLPDKLKTELALHVNLGTLKKVTIFQECEPEFLHDLVLKMRAFIFTPGDLICRKGEIAREMFIIADGLLEVISDQGEVLTQMTSGDFFGEIGILNLDGGVNRRTADVRSVGYSELFVLSREDVLSALKDHPEAEARIKAFGRMRLQEIEENRRKRKLQDQIKDNNEINTGSTQCSPVHKMVNSSADLLHKVLKLGRKQSFSADNISVLEKIGGSPDKLCENDLSMGSIFQKVIALGKQAKSQTQLDCLNERTLMAPPKLNGEKPSQSEGNLTAITEKIATKESIGRTPPRQTTKGAWTLLKGSPAGGQPKVINNQGNTYQAVHTDDDVETEQQEAMQLGEVMTKSPSNPDTMAITVEMEESDLENNSGSVPLLLTVDNSNQDDANLNLVPMNSTALDISLPMVERQQSQALSRDSTATSAISGTTGDGVNNLSQAGLWEKQAEINSSAKSVSFDNPLYSETSTHAAALASQQRAYSDEAICKHTHLSVQSHETLGPIAQACCTPIHVNSGSHAQPAQPPSNPDLHCKHDLDLATLNDPDGNIDISNSNLGNDPQLELIPFPMMPALTNGDLPHGCSMRDAATSDHESHCSQENTTIDSTNNSMTDVTPTSPAVDDVTSPVESSFPPPALPPPPSSAVLVAPEPAEHSSKTDNPSSSHNNNTSKHNCSSHNRDGKNDHPRPELNRSNAIEMSGDSMTDAEPYVSREGGNDVNRDAPFADVMGAMNAILQRKLAEYHQFYEDRIRTLEADNDLKSDTIQQLQQQVKVLQESLAATVSSTPQSDTDEC